MTSITDQTSTFPQVLSKAVGIKHLFKATLNNNDGITLLNLKGALQISHMRSGGEIYSARENRGLKFPKNNPGDVIYNSSLTLRLKTGVGFE